LPGVQAPPLLCCIACARYVEQPGSWGLEYEHVQRYYCCGNQRKKRCFFLNGGSHVCGAGITSDL
jgi:hypothetical protein